jgi:asparagine synthase (glutamine-hydrolysing)
MCGIVGFVDPKKTTDLDMLKKMTDTMQNRGPDDSGYLIVESSESKVGLGHRRLSILDLSSQGHQPMEFDEYCMVYNGEVYNFKEIRDELEMENYVFESDSDTEVVLKAFHKWGVDAVQKFRGMFTFSILDRKNKTLYIFRDRAGVKPLYYYSKNGLFLYGSELKAFHEHNGFEKSLNKESLALYLQFGYIAAPLTIFNDTYKLKPGHYIKYNLKTQTYVENKYWDVLKGYKKTKLTLDEDTILDKLEEILKESFALRMVSDVPVGTFLSGGVDSSLVTAILQKNSAEPLRTFTIGFNEKGYDEASYAREIAEYLGTEHSEYYCTAKDIFEVIHELPEIYDEPFADDSAIPTILLSRFAKESVSVVLSGDGGDETFCGYSKYFALDKVSHLAEPGIKKDILKTLLSVIGENLIGKINEYLPSSVQQQNIKGKYKKFMSALSANDFSEMFINASSPVEETRVKLLLNNPSVAPKKGFDTFNLIKELSTMEQMMLVDYVTYLPDEVLTKVDRATMSVSLEGREPLLDHKIIEFMSSVPIELKYKNKVGKYLAKELLYKYLPNEMVDRPKAGFQLPLDIWLKDDLRELVTKYLSKEKLDEGALFNTEEVLNNLQDYFEGKPSNVNEIWHILNFEMWRERWL